MSSGEANAGIAAPIPDPLPAPVPTERGPRPAMLKYMLAIEIGLLAFSDFASFSNTANTERYITVATSVLWLWFLYYLWKGDNWARVLMMCINVLLVCLLLFMEAVPRVLGHIDPTAAAEFSNEVQAEETFLERLSLILYTAFGIVWFFWLQTPAMKAFCRKPQIVST